jgi:hypothetical protein
MVGTDRGSRNKDAAGCSPPAPPAYLDGARACFPGLAENRQFSDAIDCRENEMLPAEPSAHAVSVPS